MAQEYLKTVFTDDDLEFDIQYTEAEIRQYPSIRSIFKDRTQFKRLARENHPAYKLKQKELESQKSRHSKSVSLGCFCSLNFIG